MPVLQAAIECFEETGRDQIAPSVIAARIGFDEETVQRALGALAGGQPPFFAKVSRQAGGKIYLVWAPTERARRAVRLWPPTDDLADRFITAWEQATVAEADPRNRRRFVEMINFLAEGGRDFLAAVLANMARGG